MRDLEAFVKRENAERRSESDAINKVLNAENDKRMKEAAALKDKMEKEKREMQVNKYHALSDARFYPIHVNYHHHAVTGLLGERC